MKIFGSISKTNKIANSVYNQKNQDINVVGEHEYYSNDEGYVIFCGQIYDWPKSSIKTDSVSENNAFRLFNQVLRDGIESATNLDGKFLAIIDYNDKIYIIRDYMGVGAQVYYNNQYYCNSFQLVRENKSITLEPDPNSLAEFLSIGYIPAPKTSFKDLNKLQPGEFLTYNLKRNTVRTQNILSFKQFSNQTGTSKLSFEDAIKHYKELHKKAILKRIQGKESIGVLLSGGYDSGGNLAALREVFPGKITAHSVGFENSAWSELPMAEIVANQFGAPLEKHIIKGFEIEDLPKMVYQLGDPFFENGLMVNYKVSHGISSSAPEVILGGDGNDQVFGTSSRELALNFLFSKAGLTPFQRLFKHISNYFPALFRLGFHNNNIINALHSRSFGFSRFEIKRILNKKHFQGNDKKANATEKRSFNDFNSLYFWRNYHSDIIQSAAQVILFKASQFSEMENLNITFPYIDKDIYEFLQTLPREFKLHGSLLDLAKGKGKSKFLFKQYLKNTLPSEITMRKKQGGFAPLSMFFNDPKLRSNIYTFIDITLAKTGFFNVDEIKKFTLSVEKTTNKPNDWFWYKQTKYSQLSHLLTLAIWWEQFMCGNVKEKLSDYFNK